LAPSTAFPRAYAADRLELGDISALIASKVTRIVFRTGTNQVALGDRVRSGFGRLVQAEARRAGQARRDEVALSVMAMPCGHAVA